jgi:hypothetical protein
VSKPYSFKVLPVFLGDIKSRRMTGKNYMEHMKKIKIEVFLLLLTAFVA